MDFKCTKLIPFVFYFTFSANVPQMQFNISKLEPGKLRGPTGTYETNIPGTEDTVPLSLQKTLNGEGKLIEAKTISSSENILDENISKRNLKQNEHGVKKFDGFEIKNISNNENDLESSTDYPQLPFGSKGLRKDQYLYSPTQKYQDYAHQLGENQQPSSSEVLLLLYDEDQRDHLSFPDYSAAYDDSSSENDYYPDKILIPSTMKSDSSNIYSPEEDYILIPQNSNYRSLDSGNLDVPTHAIEKRDHIDFETGNDDYSVIRDVDDHKYTYQDTQYESPLIFHDKSNNENGLKPHDIIPMKQGKLQLNSKNPKFAQGNEQASTDLAYNLNLFEGPKANHFQFPDLTPTKKFSTKKLVRGNFEELLKKPVKKSKPRSHFKVIHSSTHIEKEDLPSRAKGVTLNPFQHSKHTSENVQTPFKIQSLEREPLSIKNIQSLPFETSTNLNAINKLHFPTEIFPKNHQFDFETNFIYEVPLLVKKSVRNSKSHDSYASSDTMKEIAIVDVNDLISLKNNTKRDANQLDYIKKEDPLKTASSHGAELIKERKSRKTTDLDSHAISVNTLKTFQLLKQEEKDRRNPDFDIVETFHPSIIPNIFEIGKDDPKVSVTPQNPNVFTNTNFRPVLQFPIIPNVVNIPSSTFPNNVNTNLDGNGLNFNHFNLQQPINRNIIPLSNGLFLFNIPQHQQQHFVVPQHFLQNIPSSVSTTNAVSDPIFITSFNPNNLHTTNNNHNNINNKNNKDPKQGTNFITVPNAIPHFPVIPTIHSPTINVRPVIHDSRLFRPNGDGSFITFSSPNNAFNFRM